MLKHSLGALAGVVLMTAALPAAAIEILRVPTDKSVAEAADAFVAAVEPAGITVFARVDHGMGAQMAGADVGASQLIIFGNPMVGTPAIVANREAGLLLPLRVLVYEDTDGQVWLSYVDPGAMLTELDGIAADAEFIQTMTGALANFTARAAQ